MRLTSRETKPELTLITCTGFRPEALELCEKYMVEQTYVGDMEWIIIDDSTEKLPANSVVSRGTSKLKKKFFRGPRTWEEGLNTQRFNMEEALKHVKGDYIFFIEDDDLYKKDYIEVMLNLLEYADIVGEAKSKYYNLKLPGFKELHNYRHVALCQTAIKKSVLPLVKLAVDSGEMYFDIHLWNQVHDKRIPYALLAESNLVIGMKGMPGRVGIGEGHKNRDYLVDPGLVKLGEWCGEYASNYTSFLRKKENGKVLPRIREEDRIRLFGKGSNKSISSI